jgi:hypothetical protein
MKFTIRNFLAQAVIASFLLTGAVTPSVAEQRYRDRDRYSVDARDLVQRTQADLQRARDLRPRNEKERERIENALKHLSDFDRHLSKDKFDKDRLNEAIDDLKNVVDHNTLEPRDRDALNADLGELRLLRSSH